MKKIIVLVMAFLCSISLFAQFTQVIKGKIVDKESKVTLIGANVIQQNSSVINGTVTDIDGNFKLSVPVGRISLKISYLGYEDITISEILVMSGKEVFLNIEMQENIAQMQEVVVKANKDKLQAINSMATTSVRQLSTEDASRYAGGYNDPSRMVGSFAGVSNGDGDVNDVVIRGNSPRGLLWRLEGIEIPNPNHFTDGQGASGGSLSIITSNVLSNFDFYTGAFPAEYGNAFSGIMDLQLRKGNNDKREYAFQASVVGMEAALEGPFSKNYSGSYLVNYRYSTFSLLDKLNLIDLGNNNLAPKYQDLSMNFNLPTAKFGTFNIFGVGGKSSTGTVPEKDKINWSDTTNWDPRFDETENHEMAVIALKHNYNLDNKKTYIKTIIAGTRQFDAWNRGYLTDPSTRQQDYRDRYGYNAFRSHVMINHKINSKHTIRAGFMYSRIYSEMFQIEHNWDLKKDTVRINKSDNTSLTQAYTQWKFRITENFETNLGFHFMYFGLNGSKSYEPRFGMKWSFAPKQSINMGIGLHSKTEAIPAYFAIVRMPDGSLAEGNKNNGFTKSLHNIIGYDLALNNNMRIKVEAYYQYLYNVPIVDTVNSTMSALNFPYGIPEVQLINKGTGYNQGIEITIEKFYSNNYYFLATASIFDSKYKANDNRWYSTYFNNNFVSNVLGGYDFKIGQNSIGVNLKVLYRMGYRYTPLDLAKSIAKNDEVYQQDKLFSLHLPSMLRIDLGLNYRKNSKRFSSVFSIDIQNILNRKTFVAYEYSGAIKNQKAIEGMGLIPIVNYRIEF